MTHVVSPLRTEACVVGLKMGQIISETRDQIVICVNAGLSTEVCF